MQVTTESRHLLIQLQTGQTAAGKPKLHNRAYPHVDVAAADEAILGVLSALQPLFADPVYSMGRVDTVQIAPDSTTSSGSGETSGAGSTSGSTSGSGSGTASSGGTATSSGSASTSGTSGSATSSGSTGGSTSSGGSSSTSGA
ncbi:MAG: DUF1659 domain-containing protein [Firmicutes bacterium]|nr:DUF1659 domain-containing protein [Bacillota bacterium]